MPAQKYAYDPNTHEDFYDVFCPKRSHNILQTILENSPFFHCM